MRRLKDEVRMWLAEPWVAPEYGLLFSHCRVFTREQHCYTAWWGWPFSLHSRQAGQRTSCGRTTSKANDGARQKRLGWSKSQWRRRNPGLNDEYAALPRYSVNCWICANPNSEERWGKNCRWFLDSIWKSWDWKSPVGIIDMRNKSV